MRLATIKRRLPTTPKPSGSAGWLLPWRRAALGPASLVLFEVTTWA